MLLYFPCYFWSAPKVTPNTEFLSPVYSACSLCTCVYPNPTYSFFFFSGSPSRWLLCTAVASFVYFCVIYSYNWRNDVRSSALLPLCTTSPSSPLPVRFFSIDALTVKCSLCLHCWPHQLGQSLMTYYTHINGTKHKQSSQGYSSTAECLAATSTSHFLLHSPFFFISLSVCLCYMYP